MDIRILIVEDNTSTAKILRMALEFYEGARFLVSHAPTLSNALSQLVEHPFDIVLLDLNLPPESEGLDTVVALREQHTDIPVIVNTGGNIEITDKQQLDLKISDVIRKPPPSVEFLIARIIRFAGSNKLTHEGDILSRKIDIAYNILKPRKLSNGHA